MKVANRCNNCDRMFFTEPPGLPYCSTCRKDSATFTSKKRRTSVTVDDQADGVNENKGLNRVDEMKSDASEEVGVFNCLLCGCDFPELVSLKDREEHLEACAKNLEYKSVALSQAISGKGLTQEIIEKAENRLSQDGLRGRAFLCVICGVDLSSKGIQTRCNHLKKCAKSHGVSTRDVLQLIAPVDDDPVEDVYDGDEDPEEFQYGNVDDGEAERKEDREEGSEKQEDSYNSNGCSEIIDLCTQEDELPSAPAKKAFSSSSSSAAAAASSAPGPGPKDAFSVMMSGARSLAQTGTAPAPQPKNAFSMMMSGARNLAEAGKQVAYSGGGSSSNRQGQGVKKGKGQGKASGAYNYGGMRSRVNAPPGWAPAYKKLQVGEMRLPIVVDGFQFAHAKLTDTYFLTHFHADHYIGLEPDFACGKIYCTATTAKLVRLRLRLKDPSVLVPLELEREYSVVVAGTEVKVTLCDANHCPGAALFLFCFKTGRKVLHTGDFRWDGASMLRQSRLLRSLVAPSPRINATLGVYLDTTYCDANYSFAPQAQTIAAVVECVDKELAAEPSTLFVFGAYQIGKERVWRAVADKLQCKVHVDSARKKVMSCYTDWSQQSLSNLTTNGGEAYLWVRPMRDLNFNVMQKLREERARLTRRPCKRVVAFQPTGWSHTTTTSGSTKPKNTYRGPGHSSSATPAATAAAAAAAAVPCPESLLKERKRGSDSIMALPYSEHSSFTELVDFLKTFRPQSVVPTVNTQKDKVKSQLALLKEATGIYG